MIYTTNIADVLPMLVEDSETFERLKNDFPGILADLITFKDNPNCTCRGRVFKFFTEYLEQNPGSLDKYIKDASAITLRLQSLNEQRMANNYAGRLFVIPKGEESWKNFASTLPGKMFRMFSIAERENEIVVYFL